MNSHISHLTKRGAQKVEKYAERYDLNIIDVVEGARGDTICVIIMMPQVMTYIHCTPYGYLADVVIEGLEEEIYLCIKNIRHFLSRVARVARGDYHSLN